MAIRVLRVIWSTKIQVECPLDRKAFSSIMKGTKQEDIGRETSINYVTQILAHLTIFYKIKN